jgi:hypothetical protein
VAVTTAKEAGAQRLAPAHWLEADRSLSQGVSAFDQRDNDLARKSFLNARRRAEDAENVSRLKRFESGEALP